MKHVCLVFSGFVMNLNLPRAMFIVCAPFEKMTPQDIVASKAAAMRAWEEKEEEGCRFPVAVPPRWKRVAPAPTAHASRHAARIVE